MSRQRARIVVGLDSFRCVPGFQRLSNAAIAFVNYDDDIYKQIHGCAMGSPVSPVVANLCMEEIEETAIDSTPVPPKIWKRYVDDSFCVIKKNAVFLFMTQ